MRVVRISMHRLPSTIAARTTTVHMIYGPHDRSEVRHERLTEADELDVDDVNRLPPPRRPGTGGIPLVPADPLLALVGGADGPVDVVVDERTRCMADAAAEVDIPSPPLLAPSRLSNSGRDWKYLLTKSAQEGEREGEEREKRSLTRPAAQRTPPSLARIIERTPL